MKNINTKITNFIKKENVNKWFKISIILFALSSYFIAALNFQLIAHDHLLSSNLVASTTIGFLGASILCIGLVLYNHMKKKNDDEKIIWILYLIMIGFILSFIALVVGSIGYMEFK